MLVRTSPLERSVRLPPWTQSQTIAAAFPRTTAQTSSEPGGPAAMPPHRDGGQQRVGEGSSTVEGGH